jgi:serine protease Do
MEVRKMERKQWRTRGISLLCAATILAMIAPWNLSAAEKSSQPLAVAKDLGNAFVEVAKKVKPSVVSIRSERTVTVSPGEGFGEDFFKGSPFEDFFKRYGGPPRKQKQVGEGSGVIVDGRGYILTNHHVVASADKLSVRLLDGRELQGSIQGSDPKTDLAVIRVEAKELPVALLGDSDKIEVGEWAIAIGSPFGLQETVTVGVISAKGRSGLGTGTYEDFLQTDASINPGNSGGPLVNIDGEVIGINAMIIQPGQGIGFAIPINLAKSIMLQLIDRGKVVRPWVGIGLQDLTPELMKSFNVSEKEGAVVSQVFEGSPAEKAGFKVGDIVVSIDGVKIKNSQDVVREVLKKQVGQRIQFVVVREGKELDIPATTFEMPAEKKDSRAAVSEMKEWFGLRVTAVTPDIAKELGLSSREGVVLQDVEPESPGASAGLRKGDVILEVNREKIKNEMDYLQVMEKVKPEQGALFLVNRGGSTFFVSVKEEK